jgi:hypothetical protein
VGRLRIEDLIQDLENPGGDFRDPDRIQNLNQSGITSRIRPVSRPE